MTSITEVCQIIYQNWLVIGENNLYRGINREVKKMVTKSKDEIWEENANKFEGI